jgi:hypothetical protein
MKGVLLIIIEGLITVPLKIPVPSLRGRAGMPGGISLVGIGSLFYKSEVCSPHSSGGRESLSVKADEGDNYEDESKQHKEDSIAHQRS